MAQSKVKAIRAAARRTSGNPQPHGPNQRAGHEHPGRRSARGLGVALACSAQREATTIQRTADVHISVLAAPSSSSTSLLQHKYTVRVRARRGVRIRRPRTSTRCDRRLARWREPCRRPRCWKSWCLHGVEWWWSAAASHLHDPVPVHPCEVDLTTLGTDWRAGRGPPYRTGRDGRPAPMAGHGRAQVACGHYRVQWALLSTSAFSIQGVYIHISSDWLPTLTVFRLMNSYLYSMSPTSIQTC